MKDRKNARKRKTNITDWGNRFFDQFFYENWHFFMKSHVFRHFPKYIYTWNQFLKKVEQKTFHLKKERPN